MSLRFCRLLLVSSLTGIALFASEALFAANIRVEPYSVEMGESISVPSVNPSRFLVLSPDLVAVSEKTSGYLTVKGIQIGSSLVLVWDDSGQRSLRIQVVAPKKVTEERLRNEALNNVFFQRDQERSFKFLSESYYSNYSSGKALSAAHEQEKYMDQRLSFSGAIPQGQLQGSGLMSYRKDHLLNKSVIVPRDGWIGLFGTDALLLPDMDVIGGDRYGNFSDFGFPGGRYAGFTMIPSKKRTESPRRGRWDPSFFIGRQRDGSYEDSQAGVYNRDQTDRLAGQKIDYYLWDQGKVSLGVFEHWSGAGEGRSAHNRVASYDFRVQNFRFDGEAGLDQSRHSAIRLGGIFEGKNFYWKTAWRDINTKYNTVLGSVSDKGHVGIRNDAEWTTPLSLPWAPADALKVQFSSDVFRDRLLLNPSHSNSFNQKAQTISELKLPNDFVARFMTAYEDMQASLFPYKRRSFQNELGREWMVDRFWVKRIRPYGIGACESYTDAENSPGFNSDFWEYGGGVDLTLLSNVWISSKYLTSRLKEDEANPLPAVTHPAQFSISAGMTQPLWNWPAFLSLSTRYVDHKDMADKIHQPYLREDRFEAQSRLEWNLKGGGSIYAGADAARSVSAEEAQSKKVDFTFYWGMRHPWNTGFVIRGHGSIEGYVFHDLSANGIRDPGEPGFPGMELTITDGRRMMTDAQGYYRFERVSEGPAEVVSTRKVSGGFTYTTLNRKKIDIYADTAVKIDFGMASFLELQGRAFLDVNENMVYDEGIDKPLSDIEVRLNTGQSAQTAQEGRYFIKYPGSGKVVAQIVLDSTPSGLRTRTPIEKEMQAKPGEALVFDIVFTAERTASGRVFVDGDGDGAYGNPEKDSALSGVKINADQAQAVSDAQGLYVLRGLKPGIYPIQIDPISLPAGLSCLKPSEDLHVTAEPYSRQNLDFVVLQNEKSQKENGD